MLIALKNYQHGGLLVISLATATFIKLIKLLKTPTSKYTK